MMITQYFAKCIWRFSVIFVQIVLPVAFPVLHVPRFSMPPPHVVARSRRLGNRSFALSRKNGEAFLGTRAVFAFSSRVLARVRTRTQQVFVFCLHRLCVIG